MSVNAARPPMTLTWLTQKGPFDACDVIEQLCQTWIPEAPSARLFKKPSNWSIILSIVLPSDFHTRLFVLRAITLLVYPGVHLFLRLRAASGEDGGFSHDEMKTDLTGRVRAVHFLSSGNMISRMESFRIRSPNYIRVAPPACRIGRTIRFALHPHLVCAHLSSLLQRKSLGGRGESRPRLWSGLAT